MDVYNINEVDDYKKNNHKFIKKEQLISDEQYNILFDSTYDISELKENNMKSSDLNIDKELAQSKINIKIEDEKKFLSSKKWDYLDNSKKSLINNKVNKIYEEMNQNQLKYLTRQIHNCKLEKVYENFNPRVTTKRVGTLSSLDFLIETTYYSQESRIKMMFNDKAKLKPYIYKFRNVLGDGDCFYRGVIFCFLENIILTNNIMKMKELLVLYDEKINLKNPLIKKHEYLKLMEKLKISIVSQTLRVFIESMETKDIHSTYIIFLKIILYCSDFDDSIIYFTRYLLYEYISLNENKIYSKENQIELGCFLPEDFVKDKGKYNEYFFENFYSLQLMKPKSFAEKIVIYITPFVFNCTLNILLYDYGENSFVQEKEIVGEKEGELQINLLFRKAHYDIYYKKDYYLKYSDHLDTISNIQEDITFLNAKNPEALIKKYEKKENTDEDYEKIFKENSNNNNDNIPKCLECKQSYDHKENAFGLCNNCLSCSLKDQILMHYLDLLQNKEKYGRKEEELINVLRRQNCTISFQKDITIENALFNAGLKFEDLFLEIRKTLCLYCGKNFENEPYFILPCECRICTKQCFVEYCQQISKKLKIYEDKNQSKGFSSLDCYCGFRYDLNALSYMINEANKRGLKEQGKNYEEFIKLYCTWRCMVCRNYFNKKETFLRIIFKDDQMDKTLLKKTDCRHLICQKCAYNSDIKEEKTIRCKFCNSNHIINKIKKVDENNEDGSDCLII